MELTQRQKRSLLILVVIFIVSSSFVTVEWVSSSSVDWMYLLLALLGLGGSIEILIRAKMNRPLNWSIETRKRMIIVVLLVCLLELVVSLVLRSVFSATSETTASIVFGSAVVVGVPTILVIIVRARGNTY